jgi:type IV pilus assembly protein PilC
MAQFQYTARTPDGERSTGTIAATTLQEASRLLRDGDKFIVDLKPVSASSQQEEGDTAAGGGRIKTEYVVAFAHQLAVMIESGVTITEALDCAVEQAPNENTRAIFDDVRRTVHAGESFSDALARHPKVFPTVMISLMRASEASGTLGRMLERVTTYMTKEMQARKKIRGALIYPTIMFVMAVAVTIFLLGFVMPRMEQVYQAKSAALPTLTQLLLTLSNGLVEYWHLWIVIAIGLAVGGVFALRSERGRAVLDYLKIETPILGRVFQTLYINRSCRTMAMMVAAGVPILEVVELTRTVANNRFYQRIWQRVAERIEGGAGVSDELFKTSRFPRFVAQMISSGERSGRLGQVLDRVAEVTEEEFDERVKNATQLIEPLMILIMGALIGFLALAMLLPIFTLSRAVG